MNDRRPHSTRRELASAILLGAALAAWALAATARSDAPPPSGDADPAPGGPHCRVVHRAGAGSTSLGSGTLVDVTADRQRGLVLTCAHLFDDGPGQTVVDFGGGETHGAALRAVDAAADLAVLEIARPRRAAAAVAADFERSGPLTACGFGADGVLRGVAGRVIGGAQAAGQVSVRIAGAVREGDSGGGVFDAQGRLVAVVWGEADGVTYASCGPPLVKFLRAAVGASGVPRAQACVAATGGCVGGQCPLVVRPWAAGRGGRGVAAGGAAPVVQPAPADRAATQAELTALAHRVTALEQNKQDRGDYLAAGALAPYARSDELAHLAGEAQSRHEGLVARLGQVAALAASAGRAAAPAAAGAAGPAGWAAVGAATVGVAVGGWALRRRASGVGGRRAATFHD